MSDKDIKRIVPRDGWYHGLRKTAAAFKPVKIEELSEREEKEEEDQNKEE
jgi:hypothetical protein